MSESSCLVLGAGHAAAQLCASLRQEGWQGRIVLAGEEPWLPYNRPPLSKTFLAGEKTRDELLIRPAAGYAKLEVDCRTGLRAEQIDREARQVTFADGSVLGYDKLALTLGARVRRLPLPGADLPGFFTLRNLADVEAIRTCVRPGARVVVIGAGYIGLETAAMLRQLGLEVTVLEMAPRVLGRVTAPEVSDFFMQLHREEGVRIMLRAQVCGIVGRDRVEGVACADGSELPADLVVLGVGVLPNVELAREAGLNVDDGILVNEHCATSDPDIVAAGDCTRFASASYGRWLRLESVQNAADQARVAAATLCGKDKVYNALPWFWSDQYDVKLQIAGLSEGYDELVLRGNPAERRFSACYLKDGVLIAVDAVNRPQDFMLGKTLIAGKIRPDQTRLADPAVSLKELA